MARPIYASSNFGASGQASQLGLTVNVVPEPSGAILGMRVTLPLLWSRRRRQLA